MVKLSKEAAMQTSSTLRILVATAIVSALAILMTSPAQAYWVNEDSGTPATAAIVGNPGDGAKVHSTSIEPVATTSTASDGVDFAVVAGGALVVLALGAGMLLFTARHRRVALP